MVTQLPGRPAPTNRRRVSFFDRVLGVVGELLITAGVFLLLFVGWQLWWTDVVANQQQAAVGQDLRSQWKDPLASDSPIRAPVGDPMVLPEPSRGTAFGFIHVPRFGSGWNARPILEGTSLDVLEEGVGHYKNTAMPGQVGNFAIAGHRVTYGRPMFQIEELQQGDAIVIETEQGWYTYRVSSTEIVRPTQTDVIAPVPGHRGQQPTERMLTITACHPKFSARERYIVHAAFDEWQPRSYGKPASLARPAGVQ